MPFYEMGVFCHPEGAAEGHETSRYETSDVIFPPAPSLCIGKVIYKKVTLIFLCPLEGNAAKRQRVCEGKNGDVTLWRFHSAGSEESQYVPIVETLPINTDERETMGLYPSCSHLPSTIYRLSSIALPLWLPWFFLSILHETNDMQKNIFLI